MSDKVVSIETAKGLFKRIPANMPFEIAECILNERLNDLPAVPQEMTVSEFARARNRMCLFHLPFCNGCTVLPERKEFGEVIHDCPLWTLRDPDKAVAIVEAWAREHPDGRSEE